MAKYTYAIGANAQAARVSGIRVSRHLMVVYTVAGLLSGLGGVVTSARAASGQAGMGMSYELDAIAAAVIGGTSLSGGIGRITGTVVGTVILGIMTSGFTFIGFDAYIQDIVKGESSSLRSSPIAIAIAARTREGGDCVAADRAVCRLCCACSADSDRDCGLRAIRPRPPGR